MRSFYEHACWIGNAELALIHHIDCTQKENRKQKRGNVKMATDPKGTKSTLDKLKEQRDRLNARIQAAEARTKTSERKKETQRKILVGAYYLDEARKNNRMDDIKKIMDEYLKRSSDRTLFDLPEQSEN
jgi:large subunit ribosomal protein L7/L12